MPDSINTTSSVAPLPDEAKADAQPIAQGRFTAYLPAVMVVLSFVVRLIGLRLPLLEYHDFRQTQTAITVWTFVREGINPLHYQTPVLGSPWQAPFEFPTFQIAAALLAKTGLDLDVACRLTNIAFFYLSAWFLYRLCRFVVTSRALSLWILGFYLWCPFMIEWSRACIIDYASVAFALGYLYFLLRWMRDTRQMALLMAALVLGCVGYLTKITTMPVVFPAIAYWGWQRAMSAGDTPASDEKPALRRVDGQFLALLALAVAVPLIMGLAWVRHTDQVKAQSVHTVGLMSQNMKAWNYGTLADRLSPVAWWQVVRRLALLLVMPPVIAGIWQAGRLSRTERAWFWTAFTGCVLPIIVLFQLYVSHDYYYIAVTPLIAVMVGYGLYALWHGMPPALSWLRLLVGCFTLFSLAWSGHYLLKAYKVHANYVTQAARAIQDVTPEGSYVVIQDYDWNSSLLYYARRKGLMLPTWDTSSTVDKAGYTTFVCSRPHPELLSRWKYHKLMREAAGFHVYRVSDMPL